MTKMSHREQAYFVFKRGDGRQEEEATRELSDEEAQAIGFALLSATDVLRG